MSIDFRILLKVDFKPIKYHVILDIFLIKTVRSVKTVLMHLSSMSHKDPDSPS